MLKTNSLTKSSTNLAQIVAEYDGVDSGKSVKKLSKSQKTLRAWKIAKVIDSEEPSFLTSDNRLAFIKMGYWLLLKPLIIEGTTWSPILIPHKSYKARTSVRFAELRSSLDIAFALIIDKASGATKALLRFSP